MGDVTLTGQRWGRTTPGGHSAEGQLLIASGGPQSISRHNNTELQKGSSALEYLCVHWQDLSHLSVSAAAYQWLALRRSSDV